MEFVVIIMTTDLIDFFYSWGVYHITGAYEGLVKVEGPLGLMASSPFQLPKGIHQVGLSARDEEEKSLFLGGARTWDI